VGKEVRIVDKNKEVASKLKELREQHNYTTRYVGERVGISHAYVSNIENGKSELPKHSILEKFCDLYNISMKELYGDEIEIPTELKELGVEWIAFAKEMKKEKLTPDEIRKYIEVVKTLRGLE
jgi:transcriptional regulator with XRE-family HTH domain